MSFLTEIEWKPGEGPFRPKEHKKGDEGVTVIGAFTV